MPISEDISSDHIAKVADIWRHAGELNEQITRAEINASSTRGHGSSDEFKIQDIHLLQPQFIMYIAELYQSANKPLSKEDTDRLSEKAGDRWSRLVILSDAFNATGISMEQISALENSTVATR